MCWMVGLIKSITVTQLLQIIGSGVVISHVSLPINVHVLAHVHEHNFGMHMFRHVPVLVYSFYIIYNMFQTLG